MLCRGDRRAYAVVDAQGKVYSPPRLLGVKTAALKQRWADLHPQTLLMASEAKALRMAQWTRLREGSSANDGNSSTSDTATSTAEDAAGGEGGLLAAGVERQLLADIAALEVKLYQEFQQDAIGAEAHAATLRLGLLLEDFEQWQDQHQLLPSGETQLQPLAAKTGGDQEQQHADQRRLIEQLQHWQTIAAADSERRPPQATPHGGTRGIGVSGSIDGSATERSQDKAKAVPQRSHTPAQEPGDGITAWGLSPATVLLINTYTGQQAIAERERRIDAALCQTVDEPSAPDMATATGIAEDGTGEGRAVRSPKAEVDGVPRSQSAERKQQSLAASKEREQSATRAYLQELGQHLRDKGRSAYSQADRWLAERLARRGYSRQESRRVIAHSSPELMEEAPGRRVGYVRRIVERVYRRREHWQQQLAKKEKLKADKQQQRSKDQHPKQATRPRTVVVPETPFQPIIKKAQPAKGKSEPKKQKEKTKKRSIERDIEPEL